MADATIDSMLHTFASIEDPELTYTVSHTGLIVEVVTQTGPSRKREDSDVAQFVVSMVNGSMAHNPLGQFVCCVNFDEYMMDWFNNPYQQHKVIGVAYFNTETLTYGTEVRPYPHEAAATQGT